jgi:hypothetical protein
MRSSTIFFLTVIRRDAGTSLHKETHAFTCACALTIREKACALTIREKLARCFLQCSRSLLRSFIVKVLWGFYDINYLITSDFIMI